MSHYDDPAKGDWRRAVYGIIGSAAPGPLILLPGSRRWEVVKAREAGFPLENQYLIGNNPADMSNLKTHLLEAMTESDYLKIPAHPCGWLSDRSKELVRAEVKVKAAVLDFSKSILVGLDKGDPCPEIRSYIKSGVQTEGLVCVAVSSGREDNVRGDGPSKRDMTSKELRAARNKNEKRYAAMRSAVELRYQGKVTLVANDGYYNRSSRTPMIWAIYRLDPV